MTNEEISYNTKKALCDALKQCMQHKPFSKITVTELIRECNVNRKTFYYHFEDIYGLLKWMLEQEAIAVVKQFDFLNDYTEALQFILSYVEENAFFLNCIYDSIGREEMKRFLCQDFIGVIDSIIRNTEQALQITIPDSQRDFLSAFYTEGMAGMLINLFQHPDKYNKAQLIDNLALIIHTSIPAILKESAR